MSLGLCVTIGVGAPRPAVASDTQTSPPTVPVAIGVGAPRPAVASDTQTNPPTVPVSEPVVAARPGVLPICPKRDDDDPEPSWPCEEEPPNGRGMLIGGGGLMVYGALAVGGGALLTNARRQGAFDQLFCITECEPEDPPEDHSNEAPGPLAMFLFVTAGAGLIAGAVLLGVGVKRQRVWTDWRDARAAPAVQRTAYGTWTLGATLRF